MTEAYPLQWPPGWPRTSSLLRQDGARFKGGDPYRTDPAAPNGRRYVGKRLPTFEEARVRLLEELLRLDQANRPADVVLSSNLPVRRDGGVYSDVARRRIDDPGVAVYFAVKGRKMVMAQDAFDTVAANVSSLRLAIEAMRTLERHGGGTMMEKAFTGFAALPPPSPGKPWREVLQFDPDDKPDADRVTSRYRRIAMELHGEHPDGVLGAAARDERMKELNVARDAALREVGP